MHLINSQTFQLEEFSGATPPYAILSHTWVMTEEVLFQDLMNGTGLNKAGFAKIKFCAEQARRDGLQYFWVDTCCINKLSSAELTEAINSMFLWFVEADVCYVYLSDVYVEAWESNFQWSRWFTRSWTLLELLAPRMVQFYAAGGYRLTDKTSYERQIQEITGIPIRALRGDPLYTFSVAERMSWTKNRYASRPEDEAYSLLGIFDISMPILYGEGKAGAFQRLKNEISRAVSASQGSNVTGMRLLVARSDPLRIERVPVHEHPQYAILSHTWADDEVLFEDMRAGTAEQRLGYSKIKKCCELAARHGFEYVWVDACCIDKSSSSELQEAICSMYKWYKNASICYVYLEDCEHRIADSFNTSRWFTRGWTLQELIAPTFVEFYDQNWVEIGTKQSLCNRIASITSIDPLILRGANPTERSVAERMSWAASRSTTRDEDEAYSLMGLFNVFMPMLYGEGKRAFIRLQEEIIKQTEDYSIFAWKAKTSDSLRGIFAHSPAEFAHVRPEQRTMQFNCLSRFDVMESPPIISGRGLLLNLPLLRCSDDGTSYLAWMFCSNSRKDEATQETDVLCIRLQEVQVIPQLFARTFPDRFESRPTEDLIKFEQQAIYVLPSTADQQITQDGDRKGEVTVYLLGDIDGAVGPPSVRVAERARWSYTDWKLTYPCQKGSFLLAALRFDVEGGFVVVVGFCKDVPWCAIVTHKDAERQGKFLDDLGDLKTLISFFERDTDRAGKFLPPTVVVTAAMRIARSTNRNTLNFGLYITLSRL